VLQVAYAKDGKTVVSISADGTVRLWNVAVSGDLVAAACGNAYRPVTRVGWERYAPGENFPNVCR
jgi:WD40 repeat protein